MSHDKWTFIEVVTEYLPGPIANAGVLFLHLSAPKTEEVTF